MPKNFQSDWFTLYKFFERKGIIISSNTRVFDRFIADLFNSNPVLYSEMVSYLEGIDTYINYLLENRRKIA